MATNNTPEVSTGGMPQLDFSTFPNQAFWVIVTLTCLFVMVRLLIIPRMDNILANRRKVIEEDLIGAEKLREEAEELGKSITSEIDQSRLRASEILSKSKDKVKQNQNLLIKIFLIYLLLKKLQDGVQKFQLKKD